MSELLEAQQKAEEKYIMSRNESLATSLATIAGKPSKKRPILLLSSSSAEGKKRS